MRRVVAVPHECSKTLFDTSRGLGRKLKIKNLKFKMLARLTKFVQQTFELMKQASK